MCLANFLKISYVIQTHVFRKLSDLMIEWSEITIWLAITFLWCSRSWSWSDLRSLFEQVILIWLQITFRVILQFFVWAKFLIITVIFGSNLNSTALINHFCLLKRCRSICADTIYHWPLWVTIFEKFLEKKILPLRQTY